MKKSLLLSLAILALYLPAKAQLSFGIKSGVNKAWHSKDDGSAPKMQGLSTTLMFYKKVGKFIEIGAEPGIAQRGTNQSLNQHVYAYIDCCCFGGCYSPGVIADGRATDLKSSYIQLPLFIRSNLPIGKSKFGLSAKLGGGPSWLAAGNYSTQVYDENAFEYRQVVKEIDFSESDSPNRMDWGLYSGAGFGYKLGCGMLSFEMEYYHGLRDVMGYVLSKNRSVSYSLGFIIPF